MNKLELLLRAVQGLTWEGAPPLLRGDAGVAELLDVVDHRHPACHSPLAQLVQHLEVEMAEPFVPVPRFIVSARGEAEWSSHLKMEDIEAVRTAADLDEKPTTPIPNLKDALVDLRL